MQKIQRLKREIEKMKLNPSPGISCDLKDSDNFNVLTACVLGSNATPYENGIFELQVLIPDKYPFLPPDIKFITPIYHPNIDSEGRICMDSLKMPPKGAWAPQIGIESLLVSIQCLMSNPNPDDPLVIEISEEYKENREQFEVNAREWTRKYAMKASFMTESKNKKCDSSGDVNAKRKKIN